MITLLAALIVLLPLAVLLARVLRGAREARPETEWEGEDLSPTPPLAVSGLPSSARCPFCHQEAEPDPVACTACLARHHRECWDEHRQCAGCGHTERFAGTERSEGRGGRLPPRPTKG